MRRFIKVSQRVPKRSQENRPLGRMSDPFLSSCGSRASWVLLTRPQSACRSWRTFTVYRFASLLTYYAGSFFMSKLQLDVKKILSTINIWQIYLFCSLPLGLKKNLFRIDCCAFNNIRDVSLVGSEFVLVFKETCVFAYLALGQRWWPGRSLHEEK